MKKCLCFMIIFVLLISCIGYAENTIDNSSENESTETEVIPDTETKENIENSDNTENDDSSDITVPDEEEEDVKDDDSESTEKIYEYKFLSVEDAYKSYNIQNYAPDDNEKQTIYDTENIMRRDDVSGEAYIIFEIPYVSELKAISCHRQTDVAEFSFMTSKDGEEWETLEPEITEYIDENKWTRLEYVAENIKSAKYVKVIWGEEKESVHWWNPYFVGLFADSGEGIPERININIDDEISIPMYDSFCLELNAEILDQIDNTVEGEIIWTIEECVDEKIVISEENTIEIFSDMEDGLEIKLRVESQEYGLSELKTVKLCAPMPGDTDGDGVITETDIEVIIENYGKEADLNNRLCDVDKNGKIDIIDLAYAARYVEE